MVRIALLVMVFQCVCPLFLSIVVQQRSNNKEISITVQHNSIVAPLFLKEKEETENAEFLTATNSNFLLDLTSHSSNLTASHDNKHSEISEVNAAIQPALFKMFCAFII